jgi:hypothetical protein
VEDALLLAAEADDIDRVVGVERVPGREREAGAVETGSDIQAL